MVRTSKLNAQFAGNSAFAEGHERAQRYMRVGMELRLMREDMGLTQNDVSRRTGLDQADVSRIETGQWGSRGISFDVLNRLLSVFGFHISPEVKPLPGVERVDRKQQERAEIITALLDEVT